MSDVESDGRHSRDGTLATQLGYSLGGLVGLVVWSAFWLNVARLQMTASTAVGQDRLNAAFVVGTMILPAAVAYFWFAIPGVRSHLTAWLADRVESSGATDT